MPSVHLAFSFSIAARMVFNLRRFAGFSTTLHFNLADVLVCDNLSKIAHYIVH